MEEHFSIDEFRLLVLPVDTGADVVAGPGFSGMDDAFSRGGRPRWARRWTGPAGGGADTLGGGITGIELFAILGGGDELI